MRRSSAIASVLAAMLSGVAAAQDAVGPEFQVNSYTPGTQDRPRVSADAQGNFVVVWRSLGQDGSGDAVIGRRFDRLGNPRGSEFVANSFTTGPQSFPSVAAAESGGFVVVWHSPGQDGSGDGVFARRFDAAGTPLGLSEFRVNSYTTYHQMLADVASAPDGKFVIVWQSSVKDGSGYGIFGRRFDSAGGALGTEFPVNSYTTGHQGRPVVAMAPDGSFVVAWQSYHDGSDAGVFARRFDAAGDPVGDDFQVNAVTTSFQGRPDVAMDGSGAFVVVWDDSNGDGSGSGVVGQRFDSAGSRLGGEFVANAVVNDNQLYGSVEKVPSGDFVVAWSSRQAGYTYDVMAQRFADSGARIGSEFRVNTYTTSSQALSALAPLGVDKFVIIWQGNAQDGSGWGVFGQRYGDLLFRDGFETGDTSRWSATAADGGDLSVTVGASMNFTTFGLQAFVDDTSGLYVQDDTPNDETTYRARFYFHPGDFDPGQAQSHFRTRTFIGFEEGPTRRLFALVLRRQGSQYSLMGRTRLDDNSQVDTGFFPIGTTQHFVEVRWKRASAPAANDGVFELWIDGVAQASMTTLDNHVSSVDFVRMGALSVKSGASGTLYFDEFESRRETMIGP